MYSTNSTCLNPSGGLKCPECGHVYNMEDLSRQICTETPVKKAKTPVKMKRFCPILLEEEILVDYDDKVGRSPKVQALLDAIEKMKPDKKGVIFSQWTSFLDIIQQ